jgi:FMN phosphatase YigB (HAD superfamily)
VSFTRPSRICGILAAPVSPAFRYVVLDFDGTITKVEREAEPFLRAYQEYLADALGKDEDLVVDLWKLAEQRVRAEPHRFGGFEESGRIVAPPSDPYLRANAVARILCHRFGVLRNPIVRTETLQGIFRLAYRETAVCFRDDAASVLDDLLALDGVTVAIVTNATASIVVEKLERLPLRHRGERRPIIVGDAYKFGLNAEAPPPLRMLPERQQKALASWNARFAGLPAEIAGPHLPRSIPLRRGGYFRALRDEVWEDDLLGPERTIVCGDVFELDLALPSALGAHVHLLANDETPPYEVAAVAALERGGTSVELGALVERVRG